MAAHISAVLPSLSCWSVPAPCRSNKSTTPSWPCLAARINSVTPLAPSILNDASTCPRPLSNQSSTAAALPSSALCFAIARRCSAANSLRLTMAELDPPLKEGLSANCSISHSFSLFASMSWIISFSASRIAVRVAKVAKPSAAGCQGTTTWLIPSKVSEQSSPPRLGLICNERTAAIDAVPSPPRSRASRLMIGSTACPSARRNGRGWGTATVGADGIEFRAGSATRSRWSVFCSTPAIRET
mmetsp:Transcript_16890/g.55422  ORF Transcript_16890/g.55422 Transcript_16890/m.55422 type:complete len:243 (+) Transcript_16890:2783-3511(+)